MHISGHRQYFLDTIVEIAGIKSGLAVTVQRAVCLLETGTPSREPWWVGDPLEGIRLEGGVIENGFVRLMHRMGATPDARGGRALFFEFVCKHADKLRPEEDEDIPDLMTPEQAAVNDLSNILNNHPMGETPLIRQLIALPEWADLLKESAKRSIMHRLPASRAWNGLLQLDDLFQSEDLPDDPELYFDQRFIDYLYAQVGDLTKIHWRQFELLTAEYFKRCGYRVTLGPGRADGGIDVRAAKDRIFTGPDVILIQCKRLKDGAKVNVNDVKALYADVRDEGAKGIIATTTRLAPVAREYCDARLHTISRAEGDTVAKWIREMASHQS